MKHLQFHLLMLAATLVAGCRPPAVTFPVEPVSRSDNATGWDTDDDGQADFFLIAPNGRISRIGYDRTGDGRPDHVIDLDEIPVGHTRHLVIVLDGFSWDVVYEFRKQGNLRMFHEPSKVVAPYPVLTDLSMQDLFEHIPAHGYEAEFYDLSAGKVRGGEWAYLKSQNAPYGRFFHYKAPVWLDPVGYLLPRPFFRREIHSIKRNFDDFADKEYIAYIVSTAGISTKYSRQGQVEALCWLQRLCRQVLWENHGLVKITMLSDHGHSYTAGRRVEMEEHLESEGWKLTNKLNGPRDVVYIRFGLLTAIAMYTHSPAKLAEDTLSCQGVELASYADGSDVVVLSADGGRARVRRKGDRYGYERIEGDPLELAEILSRIEADADGLYAGADLLAATIDHHWPAPLQRLHRAHLGLVENPADVLVSLGDAYYSGSKTFSGRVSVASTHGSLNWINSVAFVMSTAGPLPPAMLTRQISPEMRKLLGRHWPLRQE